MLRFSTSLGAQPVCISCEKPSATYSCTLDQSLRDLSPNLGRKVQGHVCEKVLAKSAPHGKCRLIEAEAACEGVARSVTLADYQGAIAGDVETTYEPGMLELARRKVYATWVCMATMFNDC
jgi:hypothetical protein